MEKIKPRKYQRQTVIKALDAKGKVLVVSPGGSGKTVMIALLTSMMIDAGKRVLIVSHRREIIDQCCLHILGMGISQDDIGIMMGGVDDDNLGARIVLANVAVFRHRQFPDADVLIVDEAHHAVAPTYSEMIEHYGKARVFGFTATPYRLDGKGLGDVYDEMIEAAKPSELIKKNWLALPRIVTSSQEFLPDLDRLKKISGDYSLPALEKRIIKAKIIGNIVDNWRKYAQGRTTLVFAATIKHSNTIVNKFLRSGIAAEHVDGNMPIAEREAVLDRLRNGQTTVVSNCMVLSEGYDLPHCDAVILARPTLSLPLALQQANRGMRYNQGIRPIILDHAKHYATFGLPYADREYSLYETSVNASKTMAALAKACPVCSLVVPVATRVCECGYEFRVFIRRGRPIELREAMGELTYKKFVEFENRVKKYAKEKGLPESWTEEITRLWIAQRV